MKDDRCVYNLRLNDELHNIVERDSNQKKIEPKTGYPCATIKCDGAAPLESQGKYANGNNNKTCASTGVNLKNAYHQDDAKDRIQRKMTE